MAKLYNLARMTTATTGTGTITLGSAVSSYLTFAAAGVANGETVTYAIVDGSNREIGRGVYSSTGPTLTRTVLKSTNSNTAISLSGNAEVFITPAAEDLANLGEAQSFTAKQTFSGDGTVNAPVNITSYGSNPSSLANGDIWFSSNRLRYRQSSTTYEVPRPDTAITWSGAQTFTGGTILNSQVGVGATPSYGNAGQALLSGGAGAAPTWGAGGITSVVETVFSSSGTYTPNANGIYYEVVCIGGGASGGQSNNAGASTTRGTAGPGAGGAIVGFTKAQMGNAAITVTVGSGGAYNTTNITPQAGGASSFGNYITANGGPASNSTAGTVTVNTGTANVSASGNLANNANNSRISGCSIRPYSAPTPSIGGTMASNGAIAGLSAFMPGAGGGGGIAQGTANTGAQADGGSGGPGIVIVREYL